MSETLQDRTSMYRNDYPSRFETAVIVRNPFSVFASEEAENIRSDIKHLFQDVVIEDSAPDVSGHGKLVDYYDSPSGKTLWIPTGGDGTFSNLAGAMPKSPIMINRAGYANDTSHMSSGLRTHLHPAKTIERGRTIDLTPLEIKSQLPNSSKFQTELAFGYFGIGLSGHVAKNMNDEKRRQEDSNKHPLKRHLKSGKLILDTLDVMPSFQVIEDGISQTRYELLFANGSRMARVFRFIDLQLFEQEAGRIELPTASKLKFGLTMGRAALLGDFVRLDQDSLYSFRIDSDEPIMAQRDGELSKHTSGTTYDVKLSDYSAKILTRRW